MANRGPVAACLRGDNHAELFNEHADRLLSAVSRTVRTSPVNVEDACAFAWLQLIRYRPERQSAFGWLCKTAIREAIKLDRRARRLVDLDCLARHPVNDARYELDRRLGRDPDDRRRAVASA
mgnify:CR=1 FL=1